MGLIRHVLRKSRWVASGAVLALLLSAIPLGASAGEVTHHNFYSTTLERDYAYTVYRPDGYGERRVDYPVIYLLHGSFGSDRDWVNRGALKETADRLIAAGEMPPTVIVMPKSRSWWVDGHNEPAGTAFLENLIPHIQSRWDVVPGRGWRAIGGLSAGGYGTINFILRRPDLFGAAAALSPASYDPLPPPNSSARRHAAFAPPNAGFDAELWQKLNYTNYVDGYLQQDLVVPLYLSAGRRDVFDALEQAQRLQAILQPHQPEQIALQEFGGGHTWRVWEASLEPALRFISRHLEGPIPAR